MIYIYIYIYHIYIYIYHIVISYIIYHIHVYIYDISIFESTDLSVSNRRIPRSTPQLLIQAQLRRLMGSDEQVLVLDVYCALAPKELMACVQLSE